MDAKKTGKISREPDGYTVRFERHYNVDAMVVWDAITNPRKLAIWFMKTEMELKPGAKMTIHYGDEDGSIGSGKITEAEPGRLFEYIWENEDGPDELTRWEIFPEGPASCKLVLTHSRIDEQYRYRVPAGWHIMLDHLQEVIHGRQEPYPPGSNGPGDDEIKSYYQESVSQLFK